MSPQNAKPVPGQAPGLTFAAALLLMTACVPTREPAGGAPAGPSESASRLTPAEVVANVSAALDLSVDPCQDFYQFACGTWLKTSDIPADRSRWGRGFSEIEERNRLILKDILEESVNAPASRAEQRKIGDFYASCMDEAAVEQAGLAPLQGLLKEITTVTDLRGLMQVAGNLQLQGSGPLFQTGVTADFKDPDTSIAYFLQGGLGLPERDYYVETDERSRTLRGQYEAHVSRMLEMLGEPTADAHHHAATILAFETALAKVSLRAEEARDLERIYNKIDRSGLEKTAPELPWPSYFEAIGYPGLVQINVGMPAFFAGLSREAARTAPDTLQAYLRWHLVHSAASTLPRAFVEEDFAFFGKTLSGQKEQRPRWKRCADAADTALGELLGKLYVDRVFGGASKPMALEMILGIETALDQTLPGLSWMDDLTRTRAREKLTMVSNKIGYPDTWRDYSSLVLRRGDHAGNVMAASRFEFRRQYDKVGKPVDRNEWIMTPPTVNAYYNPTVNEMVFPAGILQPPFFHRDHPRSMNYGAVGMAMGHELTHGFDDQGRKFDGHGAMREWWDPAVVARFEERARCVETWYSKYEVEPGAKVNGKLTLGENIADLGGIKQAYRAYKAWEEKNGAPPSPVPGLNNDQLFFVGFAQSWCERMTPERARMHVSVDPHSPARFRVEGPLAHFPAFSEAFACAPATPMNPKDKCEVW